MPLSLNIYEQYKQEQLRHNNSSPSLANLNLNYTPLHPLIAKLNLDLLHQNPYNPLKFMKLWINERIKQTYDIDVDSQDEQDNQQQIKLTQGNQLATQLNSKGNILLSPINQTNFHLPVVNFNSSKQINQFTKSPKNNSLSNFHSFNSTTRSKGFRNSILKTKVVPYQNLKRRNAVFYKGHIQPLNQYKSLFDSLEPLKQFSDPSLSDLEDFKSKCKFIAHKTEQSINRIIISLKNQQLFSQLTWDEILTISNKGELFETLEDGVQLQRTKQQFEWMYVLVNGEVNQFNIFDVEIKTFYTGEIFCQQSLLYSQNSLYSFQCAYAGSLICRFKGREINDYICNTFKRRHEFLQKTFLAKDQFSCLDSEERQKLILGLKEKRDIPQGQAIIRNLSQERKQNLGLYISQNRMYLVISGQFSKCKKNLNGELVIFKVMRQGQFFGQQSLLHESTGELDYTVLCTAQNSCLAYLDRETVQRNVDTYDRILKRGKMLTKANNIQNNRETLSSRLTY